MSTLLAHNIKSSEVIVDSYDLYSLNIENTSVVDVFNDNNTLFHAFQFSYENTQYFYVIDGVQKEWTDNLDSIGYSLPSQAQYIVINENTGRISHCGKPNFICSSLKSCNSSNVEIYTSTIKPDVIINCSLIYSPPDEVIYYTNYQYSFTGWKNLYDSRGNLIPCFSDEDIPLLVKAWSSETGGSDITEYVHLARYENSLIIWNDTNSGIYVGRVICKNKI